VDVVRRDVDVCEEMGEHEGVVALGMGAGEPDVFVLHTSTKWPDTMMESTNHVERDDMFEGDAVRAVGGDEVLVYEDRAAAGREAEHEGVRCGRGEGGDAFWA
jgi:hypothetical protein